MIFQKILFPILTAVCATGALSAAEPSVLRVYYIGNSVTDTVRYGELATKDGIHLNEPGSYLVGCTYFATLLRQSPVGLPTAPYGKIDAALAEIIQQTVWQIVSKHPDASLAEK